MSTQSLLGETPYWMTNKALTKHLKSIEASALMSFLIDKESHHKRQGMMLESEGELWFYATTESIEDHLFIKYRKQKRLIKMLEDANFIRAKLMGAHARTHFSIDYDAIRLAISQANLCQNDKSTFAKTSKVDLTKRKGYLCQNDKSTFDETAKVPLPKGQNYKKNKVKRTKEKEERETPSLSDAEKFIESHTPPRNGFDPFNKTRMPKYEGGNENDYAAIYDKIRDHLNSNPRTWKEVASISYCKMTPAQFKEEVKDWIRHYMTEQRFFNDPVKYLRGGRGSFVGWLKKPWAQKKYNPSYTSDETKPSTAGTRKTVKATKAKR